jgi:HSP20 family protein
MNTLNKVITWNPLREMEQATQNRFNPFFLGGFPNRMGSGEIHSLAVADWSPEVDISEDDRGYLLKADLPEMKKDDVRVTVEDGILCVSGERKTEKEEFHDGVLKVHLPTTPIARSKAIEVKVK